MVCIDSIKTDQARQTLGDRIVIIGNSGSGKTTLARALAARTGAPAIDLDPIHWAGQVLTQRDEGEARAMVAARAAEPAWIIEGVYGWLAEVAFPRATSLIWLDLPWPVCRDGLDRRGPWRGASAEQHADFLAWAEAYATRTTPTSFAGHKALFDGFVGCKHRLQSRSDIAALVSDCGSSL